jgi:hypothetical protein
MSPGPFKNFRLIGPNASGLPIRVIIAKVITELTS